MKIHSIETILKILKSLKKYFIYIYVNEITLEVADTDEFKKFSNG